MTSGYDGAVSQQFAKMMVTLAEVLGVTLTEARIRIYAKLLADVPDAQMRAAFGRAANTCRGGCFPSPGELRAFIGPVEGDAALLAWAALGRAVEDVGAYMSLEIEDGAAAEALVAVFGSWPAFCEEDEGPGLALKRQEFMAAYRQAARRRTEARRLPGICEAGGSYPDGGDAKPLWFGQIAASGQVKLAREQARLTGGTDGERAALPETGTTGNNEGEAGA